MNWKIIEISCNCELERFLTWHDAIKYMYAKKLDFKTFEIVPIEKRTSIVRSHNILTLSDLGKEEPYKDVLTIGEAARKFRKPQIFRCKPVKRHLRETEFIFKNKWPYKNFKEWPTTILKKINGSDQHKTDLKDLINNFYHLRKPFNIDSLYNFYEK